MAHTRIIVLKWDSEKSSSWKGMRLLLCFQYSLILLQSSPWQVAIGAVQQNPISIAQTAMYLESIHGIYWLPHSVQIPYPARTWTWRTKRAMSFGWISQGHTCVLGGLHIHAYGLLHNGVHMRDYLFGRWRCLGIQMELFIFFYYPHACAKVWCRAKL